VTDESGAVPGVTVTATLTDTGLTRMVVTDATGAWVISNRLLSPRSDAASESRWYACADMGLA
jgi:hypothetical protein